MKIEKLEKVIDLGEKLNKDTTPDKKKLEIFKLRLKKESNLDTSKKNQKSNTTNTQYPIRDIFVKDNEIIIEFNKNINAKDIKKFELNSKNIYKDVFDIEGYFPKAKETKLEMAGLEKIVVGQYKPNTFRIVLKDSKKIDSYFKIVDNTVVLKVANIQKNNNFDEAKKVELKKEDDDVSNKFIDTKFIDTKNSIRQIYTDDNNIIVKFNESFNKKMLNYAVVKQKGKYVHRFDIQGIYEHASPIKLSINNLEKITVYQKNKKQLRIDLINDSKFNLIYVVNDRSLVIKLSNLNNKIIKQEAVKTNYLSPFKNKVVVIDAGHGGKDVGAVGPKNRYEKDVVFAISKYTYDLLKQRGYKVYLTRTSDKFIKVNNRTKLANEKNADIFISIHANSIVESKAAKVEGIETFFLSPARSERAKRVAAIENSEDINSMSNSTKNAFLESLSRPRITASHKLAIDVQAGMLTQVKTKFNNVEDSGVREGPFWVLVGAQMPSILIEVGYISHPKESARLVNKDYQKLLANGIANGIESYFSKNP